MNPQDLTMKDISEKRKVGDSTVTKSWIWHIGTFIDMPEQERDTFNKQGVSLLVFSKCTI
jgi:hypothetical protein